MSKWFRTGRNFIGSCCSTNFISCKTYRIFNPRIGRYTHIQNHFYSTHPIKHGQDLYSVLKVHPTASQKQIKAAYYKLSKILHPDKNENSSVAHEKFTKVNEAYAILGNVTSRKNYDRSKRVETHSVEFHTDAKKTNESKRYDQWTRNHYQSALQKRDDRIKRDQLRREETQEEAAHTQARFIFVFSMLSLAIIVQIIFKYKNSNSKE